MIKRSEGDLKRSKIFLFFKILRRDFIIFWGSVFFIGVIALMMVSPWFLSSSMLYEPLIPPSWNKAGSIDHLFGTDHYGRDLFYEILRGMSFTLGTSLLVTLGVVALGILIILFSLFKAHKFIAIHSIFNIFYAIPSLLLAIIITLFFHPDFIVVVIATFFATLPYFINKIYTSCDTILKREWVTSLFLEGASDRFIIMQVLLPKVMGNLVRESANICSLVILDISALGFIGLTGEDYVSEWGIMMRFSLDYLNEQPSLVFIPCIAIMLCIFIIRVLGMRVAHFIETFEERLWHY